MRLLFGLCIVLTFTGCASKDESKKIASVQAASKAWLGNWSRTLWQNDGYLVITELHADSMAFTLSAFSGGHTGNVDGWAIVKNNIATYAAVTGDDSCIIEFMLTADSVITIKQKNGNCFTAMGVMYDGKYVQTKYVPGDAPGTTLVELGLLKTAAEELAFKKLVDTSYELFVNSTQLISEDDDLDSLHATVHASGVRGLFTFMENIIMTDSAGHIWAAVINDNKVDYFTNNDLYKDHLPNTIEKWRINFKDYPVIYKNK